MSGQPITTFERFDLYVGDAVAAWQAGRLTDNELKLKLDDLARRAKVGGLDVDARVGAF